MNYLYSIHCLVYLSCLATYIAAKKANMSGYARNPIDYIIENYGCHAVSKNFVICKEGDGGGCTLMPNHSILFSSPEDVFNELNEIRVQVLLIFNLTGETIEELPRELNYSQVKEVFIESLTLEKELENINKAIIHHLDKLLITTTDVAFSNILKAHTCPRVLCIKNISDKQTFFENIAEDNFKLEKLEINIKIFEDLQAAGEWLKHLKCLKVLNIITLSRQNSEEASSQEESDISSSECYHTSNIEWNQLFEICPMLQTIKFKTREGCKAFYVLSRDK